MGVSVFPAPSAASKTMFRTTLTTGTSYTVPAGVTYLNVTLLGGGGGASSGANYDQPGYNGLPGQIINSTLSVTAGASIAYAIGAGGAGATSAGADGTAGGTTTFTGATSAAGGNRGTGNGTSAFSGNNGGSGRSVAVPAGAGGAGAIDIEYWA